MTTLLVVIDVQGSPRITSVRRNDGQPITPADEAGARAGFLAEATARFERVLQAISREIRTCDRVLILEEASGSRTSPAILHALGPRPHILARKATFDGSSVVLEAMNAYGLDYAQVRVCGCMTTVCVLATVRGLRQALGAARVQVVADGCFDTPWSETLLEASLR